jgi:hypothetical protein
MRPDLQRPLTGLTLVLTMVLTASCSGPVITVKPGVGTPKSDTTGPASTQGPSLALAAARNLVRAAPADWQSRWQRVHKMGKSATPAILRALREDPQGAGAQAAVHLLGEAADGRAKPYLLDLMSGGTELGTEAALALGKLNDPESIDSLQATVRRAATPMTTRAAAAAALVSMGKGPSIVSFLEAIFLAASPHRGTSSRQHKIPATKTRWAHERYMIIEALRRRYDGKTFGLDEDSSWPAMRNATAAMTKHLRLRAK